MIPKSAIEILKAIGFVTVCLALVVVASFLSSLFALHSGETISITIERK